MPQYEYYCPQCQKKFEMNKAMESRHRAKCPDCNTESKIVPSVVNHTFGWTLSDKSHEPFAKDEFVKNV